MLKQSVKVTEMRGGQWRGCTTTNIEGALAESGIARIWLKCLAIRQFALSWSPGSEHMTWRQSGDSVGAVPTRLSEQGIVFLS